MKEIDQQIALCEWLGIDSSCLDKGGTTDQFAMIPNIHSLDVLHEMEGKLTKLQIGEYAKQIGLILGNQVPPVLWPSTFYFINATAAQRREALLRTLELWVEEG